MDNNTCYGSADLKTKIMNGFENIEQRVRLRQQFKDEAGTNWENMQGEPDIDYVLWLENKALDLADVVERSEQFKCEHKGRRTATELVEYCEGCKKILFHP